MICAECARPLLGGPCAYCGSSLVALPEALPAVIDYREVAH